MYRSFICTVLVSVLSVTAGSLFAQPQADSSDREAGFAPFPENRLRDFYFRQAEQLLNSGKPIPPLLPQYPGLDGGAFGHWGQNPSERSIDTTLNEVDSGSVICSRIIHFGKNTHKGVAVRLSEGADAVSAVFDPLKLTFTDSWRGGFVSRGSGRFGVHDGARAVGKQLFDLAAASWRLPDSTRRKYRGFYRAGTDVVFSYQIGDAVVFDRMWVLNGQMIRSLQFRGSLPRNTSLAMIKTGSDAKLISAERVQSVRSTSAKMSVSCFCKEEATLIAESDHIVLKFSDSNAAQSADNLNRSIHLQFGDAAAEPITALQLDGQRDDFAPANLTTGSRAQWAMKTTQTSGVLGNDSDPFAIDTLTIPFASANAFGTPMRLAGVGSLAKGKLVVSTLLGDVWVVSGVDDKLQNLTWQRIAAGLYQPLGLVVRDGKVVLGGNDQVTRLHDLNGDGEADFYECVTNDYPTTGGHDFATSLQQDDKGRLFWATASGDFGLTRLTEGEKPVSVGNGLRNCNGIGVSADGRITLATVQEGTWTPATAIFNVRNGSFHGHHGPRKGHGTFGYDLPQCFIPRGIDNSAGEICFLPNDARLGPLSGLTVGTSYGNCSHYLVLREEVNGAVQGGVVPLPGEFRSGACRLSFNDSDGYLYVAGTEGWQSYGEENGCLQRLRFTGKPMHLATKIETRSNGLLVHCNTEIDPASVTRDNVFCQQWNYLFSGAYGSPEYSVSDEGRQGHDYVPVRSVHLLPNKRSVFIEIPQLHPVMQFHLHLRLRTASGTRFTPDAYLTIYKMAKSFTDFPGYELIAKRRWPPFPQAEEYDQDPRLVEQDKFGTNFGWVSSAKKITLNAVTGLQYEPTRLRIAPGTRVALTFRNTDPSMPHNVVVVKADRLESFGDQAMMLASNPRAIATHYVPDDPGEICFSPILNPGDQYTVYFEAPKETGRYRFLCTYPGHSKVMRGSLHVIPDDQPLPPPSADEIVRRFVRRWSVSDLAAEAEDLSGRSAEHGKQVFTIAGCIKCHRIGKEGVTLGPELTDIAKRFRGKKLLQQILDPGAEINKKYQTWIAVTDEGKVLSGLMVSETNEAITLMPNPLQPKKTVVVQRDQVEELFPSKQSTMPEGLLMTFTKDEILDLLAFVQRQQ